MSETMEESKASWSGKAACWLLASMTVATALAGYIFAAIGHRNWVAAVFVAVSSFLAIGLCTILLHLYDKGVIQSEAAIHSRLLHGLMLHALFVASAALMYTPNASLHAMVPQVIAVALADAALAAMMVFLLSDVRRDRDGADKVWIWVALLIGLAVFALRFFDIDWAIWAVIAALAAAVIASSASKTKMRSNLCNSLFALAMVIFAATLLIGGYARKPHMMLHLLCLILTPIYAPAISLPSLADHTKLIDACESHCARNGKTVIYHASTNTDADAKSDLDNADDLHPDNLQAMDDLELIAMRERTSAWKAEEESVFHAQRHAKKEVEISSETDCDTEVSKITSSDRMLPEQNCNMILDNPYRALSLKYLSIAPLEAFTEISEAQIMCMSALGVHTVSELAALPMFRVAEQIVWMASREKDDTAGN